jgi:NADH-quinone oxidoreductase subunit L
VLPVAVVFLPLLGAILAGALAFASPGRHEHPGRFDRLAQVITCAAVLVAAACAVAVFIGTLNGAPAYSVPVLDWVNSGTLRTTWALKVDPLSAVMMVVVTVVSAMVHVYSIGYMAHDKCVPRFMAYLNLFTFFMLMLVTGDNLLQVFFGWEGVGLASYLLIGFWYEKPSANAAAIKAFLVNRVGDLGFILGIVATYFVFDTIVLDEIFAAAAAHAGDVISVFGGEFHALTLISLLLFIGAMGKSAQLGLHTWLPDAMEGPTPVSALIHAATMVTAGVFLVARMSPVIEYSDAALTVITLIGAATAFFAATVGCVQNDIKRIIAYSTCSQLGYMFFACGVSAYSAGIFHLMTHAFFKALLFLGAGSVIHALADEQDIRRMGGLWRIIPVTYVLMWIGSLALAGIWPFAGYWSKDIVLEAAYAAHSTVGTLAFWLGIAVAFLTAFYSWRLLILVFHGKSRADHHTLEHAHESPWVMLAPMMVLAVGAVFAGYLGYGIFVGDRAHGFWEEAIFVLPQHPGVEGAHHVPGWVKLLPLGVALAGIGLAVVMYLLLTDLPARLARAVRPLYEFALNKWYFDEAYDAIFVRPSFAVGRVLWKGGDGGVIDRFGPDGVAASAVRIAKAAARLQSGYIFHYAFAMLVGVIIIISWFVFRMAGA